MDIETYVQRYYLERILYAANRRFGEMSAGQFELRMCDITKAGVYDIVRRCRKQLQGYEAKLHLVAKFIHTKERVAEINHYANEILEHQENHQRMIECINRIEMLSNTIVEEL